MVEQNVIENVEMENNHKAFYVKMAVFLSMIFARNIFEIPIPALLFLIMAFYIAATGDRDEIVTMGICCLPLFTAFQYKYAILLYIIVYWFRFPKDIRIGGYAMPLVLMMIWELFHGFGQPFSFNEYFRGFAELMFCTFLLINKYKKYDYRLICRMLAVCTIAMSFIVLLNLLESTNYNFEKIFTGSYRFGIGDSEATSYGVNYNSNELGFICNISIVGLLQQILLKKQKKLDYLMIVLLMFFGFLTMSRSFLFCCVMILVLFVFSNNKNISVNVKSIMIVSVFVVTLFIILNSYAPFVVEKVIERFQVGDISTGRFGLMEFYHNHIMSSVEHLIFGVGLQDVHRKIYLLYGKYRGVPHNGIQEILVCWGIPGLVFFVMFVKKIIRASLNAVKKHRLSNYLPLILVFVKMQTGQSIRSGSFLLTFLFIYVSLCVDFEEGKNANFKTPEKVDSST